MGAECLYAHSEVSSEADIKALVEKLFREFCTSGNGLLRSKGVTSAEWYRNPVTVYSKSRRSGTDGIYESSRINCVW